MRVKLDENMPRRARELLENLGWDVHDVHEEGLASAPDNAVWSACERERRTLITLDTDFSDVRRLDAASPSGIVLLRPRTQSIDAIVECLNGAIRALDSEPIRGNLWMVEPDRIRIRTRD
jgi:predicted nuclease of predicted toxin-antitoxin system